MANEREQRVAELDPNRTKVAKSMVTHAGAPMMNNPMNAGTDPQPSSFSGVNESPYGDIGRVDPMQMGGVYAAPNSGLAQSNTLGAGYQRQYPYGQQPQPPSIAADPLESSRLDAEAKRYGLNQSAMGPLGMPATPAPGALPAQMSAQSPNSLGLQGMQSAEAAVGMKPAGMNTKSGKR